MSRGEAQRQARRPNNVSGGRESVESFVLVFLFFLVLGLEAEGFVIPTGSMAPTLMGRHKEVTCPQCGLVYAVNADREVNASAPSRPSSRYVEIGTCVNCRFPARIGDEPSFQGDRVYVMKTPVELPLIPTQGSARLQRWDVAVFKLPENPEVRYIKRLVGMPGEEVSIRRGDIWTRPLGMNGPFRRALRPLKHQDAMQMLVYDDSHRARALAGDNRWERWSDDRAGRWSTTSPGTYRSDPAKEAAVELTYRHVVPDPAQWAALAQGRPLPHEPRATLVTDFYSYNTDLTADSLSNPYESSKAWLQAHWVGDLTLDMTLNVVEPAGKVVVRLTRGGVASRCEFDLAAGLVTLYHGGEQLGEPAPSGVGRPGAYAVSFSNVDDRLALRVDGRTPFGDGLSYDPGDDELTPTEDDLRPAGVTAAGAAVEVSGLVLKRDIYYTLGPSSLDYSASELGEPLPNDPVSLFDWLADPRRFATLAHRSPESYAISPGRYLMLGDNSPWSRDSRAWVSTDQVNPELADDDAGQGWDRSGRKSWEVPEALLIGKAFCVYWPHFKPFGPAVRVGRDLRLPARPYLEKIRWIR
jgi:signal peptidase I